MMRIFCPPHAAIALASLSWLLCGAVAEARKPAVEQPRSAQQYETIGTLSLVQRDFGAAYEAFATAYRLEPSADRLYQLGIVASAEDKSVEAHDLLRRYLAEVGDNPTSTDKATEAQRVLAQPLGPTGEVRISGEPGIDLLLDERFVGRLPLLLPLLVAVGPHKLALVTPAVRRNGDLQVQAGRTLEVRDDPATSAVQITELPLPEQPKVEVEPPPVEIQPPPPPPRELRWQIQPRPRWRLAIGAVSVATGITLVGLGSWALSVNGGCIDEVTAPVQACSSLYSTSGVGAGLLIPGVLLTVGGGVLLALPGPRRQVAVERSSLASR